MYTLLSRSSTNLIDLDIEDDHSCPSYLPPAEFLKDAIFAGGTFRELEAAFCSADGVARTAVGYYGGSVAKPSHEEVLEGKTGHTEAVKVTYDNRRITYKSLCKLFFESHDPTNKEYLGFGLNTHRRSAIFYSTEEEGKSARESKVEKQMKVNRRVVTVILKASTLNFHLAECQYQKHYLHLPHLLRVSEGLALRSSLQFAGSHLACKLNGIFGGEQMKAAEKLVCFLDRHQIPEPAKKALQEILLDLQLNCSGEQQPL